MNTLSSQLKVRSSRRDFFRSTGLLSLASVAPAFVPTSARAATASSTDTNDNPIYMSATKLAGLIRAKKISASP